MALGGMQFVMFGSYAIALFYGKSRGCLLSRHPQCSDTSSLATTNLGAAEHLESHSLAHLQQCLQDRMRLNMHRLWLALSRRHSHTLVLSARTHLACGSLLPAVAAVLYGA
jgi:hypothetical protein